MLSLHASRFTLYALRFTPYASRLTLYAHEPDRRDMSNVETRPLLTLSLNEKLVKIDIMLDGLIKKLKKDMAKIK